jgi:tetratricopeptide (TPR) repeat protein
LKNYAAAISDATSAIELAGREIPTFLNQRAYIRALANLNKQDLEAGLRDVERAIELSRDNRENAAFIDTRGYLLYRLGRHDEALKDMERAIELMLSARDSAFLPSDFKRFKESMAVMFYHRGVIYEALGRHEEAAVDLLEADRLGYDPDAGVL